MIERGFILICLFILTNYNAQYFKKLPKKFMTSDRINKAESFAKLFFKKCDLKDYSEIQGYDFDVNSKKNYFTSEKIEKNCKKIAESYGKVIIGKTHNAITPTRLNDYIDYFVIDARTEKNDSVKYVVVSLYRDKDFIYTLNFSGQPYPIIRKKNK